MVFDDDMDLGDDTTVFRPPSPSATTHVPLPDSSSATQPPAKSTSSSSASSPPAAAASSSDVTRPKRKHDQQERTSTSATPTSKFSQSGAVQEAQVTKKRKVQPGPDSDSERTESESSEEDAPILALSARKLKKRKRQDSSAPSSRSSVSVSVSGGGSAAAGKQCRVAGCVKWSQSKCKGMCKAHHTESLTNANMTKDKPAKVNKAGKDKPKDKPREQAMEVVKSVTKDKPKDTMVELSNAGIFSEGEGSECSGGDDEEEGGEIFEVEAIKDKRMGEYKDYEYLIAWKGYGQEYDTWEPRSNMACEEILAQFEKKWEEKQLRKKQQRDLKNAKKREKRRLDREKEQAAAAASASSSKDKADSSKVGLKLQRKKVILEASDSSSDDSSDSSFSDSSSGSEPANVSSDDDDQPISALYHSPAKTPSGASASGKKVTGVGKGTGLRRYLNVEDQDEVQMEMEVEVIGQVKAKPKLTNTPYSRAQKLLGNKKKQKPKRTMEERFGTYNPWATKKSRPQKPKKPRLPKQTEESTPTDPAEEQKGLFRPLEVKVSIRIIVAIFPLISLRTHMHSCSLYHAITLSCYI